MLTNETGLSAADVAAVMNGNGNNNGFGWGDNSYWLIILFLFMFNGGWNNGFGSNPGVNVANDVQRGFDQNAVITGITGVQTSLTNGFSDVNQALCNGFAGVSNGFAQAEIGANNRQMANMNQMFGIQQSISNLGYNVATEACSDRQAVNESARDIIASNTANTNALMNAITNGIQSLHNEFCQDRLDGKDARISDLERQLTMATLAASQGAQTAQITNALMQKAPIAAYTVPNPNGCPQQNPCCHGSF